MPLVTVGIPCYNSENYITLSIKSVLNQTLTDFELIITDDGSTDRTVEIARSFDDPRIKVLYDGENRGISYRLNQQIDLARGKYFARMDSDDIMLPERLEKQIEYLVSHPSVSVVSSQAIIIDNDNNKLGIRLGQNIPYKITFEDCLRGRTMIHPTVTGTVDFFKKYRYRDKYKGVEDFDLWLRSCNDCELVVLPSPMILYRDPLTFKMSSYRFRMNQSELLFKEMSDNKIITKANALKLITLCKIKTMVACALNLLHLDSIMIARRNQPLPPMYK